jgi:hypothetical protein
MFFISRMRGYLFGERFAVFSFGYSYEIRKIRTNKDGNDFAFCYGQVITPKDSCRKWNEL